MATAGKPIWNTDSPEAVKFWFENGDKLTPISKIIGEAFSRKDGNCLLLMQAALVALSDGITEGMARHGVKIEVDSADDSGDDSSDS